MIMLFVYEAYIACSCAQLSFLYIIMNAIRIQQYEGVYYNRNYVVIYTYATNYRTALHISTQNWKMTKREVCN